MPFVALSRSRAFLLLLLVLLQFGLAPALPGSCAPSDEASVPCCATMAPAVSAAQMMDCHDSGVPEVPDPEDEDPGCLCTIDVAPTPAPSPWSGPTSDSSPVAGFAKSRGTTPQPSPRGREQLTPPRAGVGPPIYRLYCVLLI